MRLLIAAIALFVFCGSFGQVSTNDPHKIGPTVQQLAELDLANRILPLVMTKEQIGKMLPEIEKARKNIRDQERKEADRLKALQPDIDKYHADILKGKTPPQEFLDRVTTLFKKFESERLQVKVANALILADAMKKNLNEGQIKAAVGVVDKIYDEKNQTWTGGTTEAKLQYYAISIFLGERAYDLLVRMSR
ncbi:MAG: hypothetical protein M3R13_07250 [Armatimonadota bacterium]|nr:hypothetical protein [Armatimonadota bacterium]